MLARTNRNYPDRGLAATAFPAVAVAAAGGEEKKQTVGRGTRREAQIAPLQRPVQPPAQDDRRRRSEDPRRAAPRAPAAEQAYATLPGGVSSETLEAIAACESGGDPTAVSADGSYRGKYQFDYGTWASVGG